jgi:RND family efflux transporter MFP subunit
MSLELPMTTQSSMLAEPNAKPHPSIDPETHREHSDLRRSPDDDSQPASQPRPKGAWLPWVWIGAAALCGFWLRGFLFHGESSERDKLSLSEPSRLTSANSEAVVVTVAPVTVRSVTRTIQAVGTLHAFEEVAMSSKLEGRVKEICHDVSDTVMPGEVLLRLDDTDATLAVEQAERQLKTELAKWGFEQVPEEEADISMLPTVESARLKYELALARLNRMEPLRGTQSISVDDYEQARSDAQVLQIEWTNQQLQAKSAAATARLRATDLAIARQRLSDCEIRVPLPTISDSGPTTGYVVADRMAAEGSLIRPGTEVFRLVLGKTLKLRLSVPETLASSVRVGQQVEVFPSSLSNSIPGTVIKVAPSIDRTTRTLMVEVSVPNVEGVVKSGGFAKAAIQVEQVSDAKTVPQECVYSLAGVQKLFVYEQGVAREHQVTLGEQQAGWVEVLMPKLNESDLVITSGQKNLSEGIPVTLRETDRS